MGCAQVEAVLVYQPHSQPLLPAYYLALDAKARMVNFVVRGTTTWQDAMTDLVAHCEPLGSGERPALGASGGASGCAWPARRR